MTLYAQFDPTAPAPQPVTGWYDTATLHYPNLPPSTDLVEVDDATWAAHFVNPSGYEVNGSTLQLAPPPTPPTPPLNVQAAMMMGGPVTVSCASMPSLDGAYPLDATTQFQITSIASAINAGLGLPSGESTFNWPDAQGNPHAWDETHFVAFSKAVLTFLYACSQVMQGHSTTLPSTTLSIP